METIPDFLGGLWDRATGLFDRVVDFEFASQELKLQKDIELLKRAQAAEAQRREDAFFSSAGAGGLSTGGLLVLIAVGAGVYLLVR